MSDQDNASKVKHTKTFKKYRDEFRPEVVEATREWAKQHADKISIYEDASIVKVTGIPADIDAMIASLRERFGEELPGEKVDEK